MAKAGNVGTSNGAATAAAPPSTPAPQLYAQTVARHAQKTHRTSLYPGQNYQKLAEFLAQPYGDMIQQVVDASSPTATRLSRSGRPGARDGTSPFLTVYQYCPTTDYKPVVYDYSVDQEGRLAFERRHKTMSADSAQLQFMSGFAPAQWLNLLGSCFRIDPEFFRRHLSFMLPYNYFDVPNLPSATSEIVQLPLMTIATRTGGAGFGDMDPANKLQQYQRDANMKLTAYLRQIDRGMTGGHSVVRQLYVHSAEYYSVEQRVSISVQTRSQKRWTALIWFDCGTDSLQSYLGEWLSPWKNAMHYALLPVFQFRDKIATKKDAVWPHRGFNDVMSTDDDQHNLNSNTHSAALLPAHYGQSLQPAVMQADAFYAISELFAFSAASENQFMNLLETTIDNERDPALNRMQAAQENLQAAKSILEAHIKLQQSIVATIKSRGSPAWPKATDEKHIKIVDQAADQLLQDWKYLLEYSGTLRSRCIDLVTLVTNKAMLDQAQRGIDQAQGLARLTLLAFFFVPLSFTTSFFGMSFKELGTNNGPTLSIYVWFCVSLPLFAASLAFLFWESIMAYLAQNGMFSS